MVPLPKMIRIVLKVYYLSLLILNNYLALKVVGKEIETNNGANRNYFMANEDTEYVSDEYADIKQQIGLENKEADIFFQKVTKQLKKQLEKIKEKGDEIIPETTFQKIINNNDNHYNNDNDYNYYHHYNNSSIQISYLFLQLIYS